MTKDDIRNNFECALEYTIEMWDQLAKTGLKKDSLVDMPVYLNELINRCALCEFFSKNYYGIYKCFKCCEVMNWSQCILSDGFYGQWVLADLESPERKKFAKQISDRAKAVLGK
jgi:hypothetical protein